MSLSKSYMHTPQVKTDVYCTISERLEFLARQNPDKPAFVIISTKSEKKVITRKELYEKSINFAKGLIKHGIKVGDIVGISLQNSLEWLICTFGAIAAGAIPTFFYFNKINGEDIVETFNSLERCAALIFRPGNEDINWKIFEKISKMEAEKGKVSSANVPTLHLVICDTLPSTSNHPLRVDDILIEGCNTDIGLPESDPDDICVILLTSGSTGVPKAVPKSHMSILTTGIQISFVLEANESDHYYSDSLFVWQGGFPSVYLAVGSTRVTVQTVFEFSSITERTEFAVKCIENENCTIANFFPYCLMVMSKEIFPCKQWPLKSIVCGGLPVPSSCADVGCKIARKFVNGYGSTEVGPVLLKIVHDPVKYQSSMVGIPFPGVEIKIMNDNGATVPINTMGEILVRNNCRFLGYINNREKTYAMRTESGWCHTDDIGLMDENGDVIVLGRKSEVMIIAGAIIHPASTEEKIKKHPDVEDVCVVPVEDEKLFQQQCACVVPIAGTSIDKESIVTFLKKDVAFLSDSEYGIDIPRYFIFLDELPRTPVGKIFRKGLIEIVKKKLHLKQ